MLYDHFNTPNILQHVYKNLLSNLYVQLSKEYGTYQKIKYFFPGFSICLEI